MLSQASRLMSKGADEDEISHHDLRFLSVEDFEDVKNSKSAQASMQPFSVSSMKWETIWPGCPLACSAGEVNAASQSFPSFVRIVRKVNAPPSSDVMTGIMKCPSWCIRVRIASSTAHRFSFAASEW